MKSLTDISYESGQAIVSVIQPPPPILLYTNTYRPSEASAISTKKYLDISSYVLFIFPVIFKVVMVFGIRSLLAVFAVSSL